MPFVVKAVLGSSVEAGLFSFSEKTMYGGKDIRIDDEIFVFDSDHQGCGFRRFRPVIPG
jgi:hypothetical protein